MASLHPELQKRLQVFLDAAKKDGWWLQIVQGLRTFAEQQALYDQGRKEPGKRVRNAPAGPGDDDLLSLGRYGEVRIRAALGM